MAHDDSSGQLKGVFQLGLTRDPCVLGSLGLKGFSRYVSEYKDLHLRRCVGCLGTLYDTSTGSLQVIPEVRKCIIFEVLGFRCG